VGERTARQLLIPCACDGFTHPSCLDMKRLETMVYPSSLFAFPIKSSHVYPLSLPAFNIMASIIPSPSCSLQKLRGPGTFTLLSAPTRGGATDTSPLACCPDCHSHYTLETILLGNTKLALLGKHVFAIRLACELALWGLGACGLFAGADPTDPLNSTGLACPSYPTDPNDLLYPRYPTYPRYPAYPAYPTYHTDPIYSYEPAGVAYTQRALSPLWVMGVPLKRPLLVLLSQQAVYEGFALVLLHLIHCMPDHLIQKYCT
jgi:hypothetical protein